MDSIGLQVFAQDPEQGRKPIGYWQTQMHLAAVGNSPAKPESDLPLSSSGFALADLPVKRKGLPPSSRSFK